MYESLGLTPVRVTDPGTSPWSFEWLRHEIAEPAAYAVRTATWLTGERNGAAVVVRPVTLPGDNPYIAVVAEIDPPVFAGLHLVSQTLFEPFRFQPQGTALGSEPVDRAFSARAHDPIRAVRLFTRSEARATGDAVLRRRPRRATAHPAGLASTAVRAARCRADRVRRSMNADMR